ncbi:MAG TPA: hypothetical protein VK843_14905 [Planctomycetota bacterium]|nr:hypothetical protein [Planctomycetota bacterium]
MSGQEKQRKDGEEVAPAGSPAECVEKAAVKTEGAKPGMKYVFKIQPADPKRNSIDFEDVADK